jgi:hypothetical protein
MTNSYTHVANNILRGVLEGTIPSTDNNIEACVTFTFNSVELVDAPDGIHAAADAVYEGNHAEALDHVRRFWAL